MKGRAASWAGLVVALFLIAVSIRTSVLASPIVLLPKTPSSVAVPPADEATIETGSEDTVRVIIQLKGDPVARYKLHLRTTVALLRTAQDEQIRAYANILRRQQEQLATDLRGQDIELQVRYYYGYLFNGLAGTIRQQDLERIAAMPLVQAIELDHELHVMLAESVPLIGANQVWTMLDAGGQAVTGRGIRVAVLDTGIDYTHPDLGGCFGSGCKVVGGYDVTRNYRDPFDDNGHGTHCAGIIAANGAVKGVAPDALLYAYKVLDAGGHGLDSDVIAGIELALNPDGDPATDDAVDVISMSLGGPGGPDDPLSQAVDSAVDQGVVVAVAAGNGGPAYGTLEEPGTARKAFTVGASDKSDAMAEFSARGPLSGFWELIKPDIIAPGVSIRSTVPAAGTRGDPSRYKYLSGTSMATPHIAGCVALIKQLHPSWSPEMIQANLMNTARDLGLFVLTQGAGRVQVGEAARAVGLLTPGSVSFGLVDAQQAVWTQTVFLQLSNISTDSLGYSFAVSGTLPTGASVVLDPANVTLGAGQSATITAELTVDNALTPYAQEEPYVYEGRIVAQPQSMAGSQATARPLVVPFTFSKLTRLEITFDWEPYEVLVHDGVQSWRKTLPGSHYGWVLPPGTYDVIANSDWGAHWILRQGVVVTEVASLDLSIDEAVHQVGMVPRDKDGHIIAVSRSGWNLRLRHRASGIGIDYSPPYHVQPAPSFLSNVSADYAWEFRMDTPWEGDWYELNYQLIGVTGDSTQQNDPANFRHLAYHFHCTPTVTSMNVWVYPSTAPEVDAHAYYFMETFPPTTVRNAYYMPFPPDFGSTYTAVSVLEEGTRDFLHYSPYLVFKPGGHIDAYPGASEPVLAVTGDEFHLGQAPPSWFTAFHNTATQLILQPVGSHARWFGNQAGDRGGLNGLPYELYQGGVRVLTGSLPSGTRYWWDYTDPEVRTIPSPGAYTFTVSSDPYWLQGQIGYARLVAEFDTNRVDKDPPTLLSLQTLLDGETTSLLPPDYGATVQLRVQDASGIAETSLSYRSGGDWIVLPTMASEEHYSAQLPGLAGGQSISLRLFVRDTAGNSLQYEVVPALLVTVPAPVLTSPTDGWTTLDPEVTFTWDSAPSAVAYRIQIDTTPVFTSPQLISTTVLGTSYPTCLNLGQWYWHVLAIAASGDESSYSTLRRFLVAQPALQLTTDAGIDMRPALEQASAGRLWAVWAATRSAEWWDIWYKTSDDGGATWSADAQLTTDPNTDIYPDIFQAADGRLWVLWTSYRAGVDTWFKTSDDNGVTWSADTRLTTAAGSDEYPTIGQTSDGKLWVVWQSDRSGNSDVWYKTSSDHGATWSADFQLTTDPGVDSQPAIAEAANGVLWVVWSSNRHGRSIIWCKTSNDGGNTWSTEVTTTKGFSSDHSPSLIRDRNGTLWMMWESSYSGNADLWYNTNTTGNAFSSTETQWSHFLGSDREPDLAVRNDGAIALVWTSEHSSNRDIWFGIIGQREDVPEPAPTPTATLTPLWTPTPTRIATPTPTRMQTTTPIPTWTATVTLTPTLTPTPTPLPPSVPELKITLQQGRNGYTGSQDTYIEQYAPDTNYCSAGQIKAGYHQQYASIVRFDVTSVPTDVVVTNATLQVYANGWDGENDIGIDAFYIKRPVNLCQATWNQAQTGVNWGAAGCNHTVTDRRSVPEDSITTTGNHQWYNLDLTAVVQGWVDGSLANNGVLLRASQFADLGPFYFASAENSDPGLRPKLVISYRLPAPVQVTTDPHSDGAPSLVRAWDGTLWVVWARSGGIWLKTSQNDGRTWSADARLTTDTANDASPDLTQLADGRLWLVWISNRSGQNAVWQRFGDDGGATWSNDTWVANMPEYGSTIATMQSSDGRLWVVGGRGPWFITSADGGGTWSSPTSLDSEGLGPDIFQVDSGTIWVVYTRNNWANNGDDLCSASSTDGGLTWSQRRLAYGSEDSPMGYYSPHLAQTADATLVLMWGSVAYPYKGYCQAESLGYKTSSDGGVTWSVSRTWLAYLGPDRTPSMALLGNAALGVVWESSRAGNNDIWFGILGATEDLHPPPYICCVEQLPPGRDPYDDEQVDIGTSPLHQHLEMYLVWSINGTPQPDMVFVDESPYDIPHPCMDWYVHLGPFPAGTQVTYQVRAVDSDGDSVLKPSTPSTFTVLARPTATPTQITTQTPTETAIPTLTGTPTATMTPTLTGMPTATMTVTATPTPRHYWVYLPVTIKRVP